MSTHETSDSSPSPSPCPGMPPSPPCPDPVPGATPLIGVAWDNGTLGHLTLPDDFVSYRITCDNRNTVFDIFENCSCVIAEEFSRSGVQHYHVVVAGHAMFDTVRKRLQRAKFGSAKYWSQKNRGTFLGAISYTVKCGEYWTRLGFNEFVKQAPDWKFPDATGVSQTAIEQYVSAVDKKDLVLNYNNIVYYAVKEARQFHHTADWSFSDALRHFMDRTGVTLSYNLSIHGAPDFYHDEYKTRLGHQSRGMDWLKYRF